MVLANHDSGKESEMAVKRQQSLFEGTSSTEITPLSEAIRERLRSSESLRGGVPVHDGGAPSSSVSLPPALDIMERLPHAPKLKPLPSELAAPPRSAHRGEMEEFDTLANLLAPPASLPASVK